VRETKQLKVGEVKGGIKMMSARERRFYVVLVILIVGVLLCPGGWQSAQSATATQAPAKTAKATPTPRYGGTFKVLAAGGPTVVGYVPELSGQNMLSTFQFFEPLVDIDEDLQFLPTRLVSALKVAPDGKSVTMTLKKGIKFHDGTDFNAQAAKWNLEGSMKIKYVGFETWESVDALDDYTVRVNLKQRDFAVVTNLSKSGGWQASPTAFAKNGLEWARKNPVGTGPFRFVSFDREVSLKSKKFEGYWRKGLPYLDAFDFYFIKDPMVRQAAFEAGEGQALDRPTPKQAYELKAKGYEVIGPWPTYMYLLGPDSANPDSPFRDKRVREALEYAIDRQAIAKALGYGFFTGMTQPIPPEYRAGYNPDIKGRPYDPNKARQLLAEAGYPQGLKTKIFADEAQVDRDILVAIQGSASKSGIDIALELVPRAKYFDLRVKGWYDGLIYITMGMDFTFTNTISRTVSIDNLTYKSMARPPGWKDLVESAVASPDAKTYFERCRKTVKALYDDATYLPLFGSLPYVVLDKSVHDTGWCTVNLSYTTPEKTWLEK
jgi:peptide/nickel transport system substrate-binding protein